MKRPVELGSRVARASTSHDVELRLSFALHLVALLAPLALVALPASASAQQQPSPAADPSPPLSVLPDHFVDPTMARSWGEGPSRPFLSTMIDFGYVYFRPRVAVGYGKPFTSWIGIEANPNAQTAGIGAYAGVRLAIPFFDLRAGSRYFYSFQRSFLTPAASYSRVDLDQDGSPAKMATHEVELNANIPVGPGDIMLLGSGSIVTGVPDGQYAFEETLRVIVKPPYVWRARGGYSLKLGPNGQYSFGLVAEVLDVPRRDDSVTVRAGPVLRVVLSRRVEVRGSFVVTLKSPDQIGLVGGDFTELGLRYRWATE